MNTTNKFPDFLIKSGIVLFIVFVSSVNFIFAQQDSAVRQRLIIMHPTNLLIDYYKNLIDKKLLPDTIEYIGVYHEDEQYDFSKTEHYADSVGLHLRWIMVRGNLSEKDVYAENICTPVFKYLFNISSGIIFNGGPDIQPELYGAETSLMTSISDPERHIFEMSFIFHLLGSSRNPSYIPLLEQKPHYLILGICLGMQSIVTTLGGTLVQDIPTEIYKKKTVEQVMAMPAAKRHKNYYKVKYPLSNGVSFGTLHEITTDNSYTFFADCGWDKTVQVYSYHHQSAKKLPPGLKAVAWSVDKKVIEAVAHTKYKNVIGIQFHPEPDFLYLTLKKTYLSEGDKMTMGRLIESDKTTMKFLNGFWSGIVKKIAENK